MAEVGARRARLRPWLRALHRDVGYLAVGLTFVYALSGIAVNHITDWTDGDPSFAAYEVTHELGPLAGDDLAVAIAVEGRLGITTEPREVYRASAERLDIVFDKRTLHVDPSSGRVIDEGQRPRFLLRAANWLHLNRGKKAWTFVADAYAAGLLLLATSGVFMIAGKKGILGRGAVLVAIGAAIPIVYVQLAAP
jgi:uncharacterized protein